MIKSFVMAAAAMFATVASAASESFEVCTYEGPCALRVSDTETQSDIWLVTEAGVDLPLIWNGGGEWYLTSESDYAKVRDMIPEAKRWSVKGINPTTGMTLMEAKAAPKPAPAPGPLIGGSITITTTIGGSACTDCHTKSAEEIHKKKLTTGGN